MNELNELLKELSIKKVEMDKVERRLIEIEDDPKRANEWEILYGREFELTIQLSGIHGDIKKISKRIKNSENELEIKRILKKADDICKPLVVEL